MPYFIDDLEAALADDRVWTAIIVAVALGALCFALGVSVARVVGLLSLQAPRGEMAGVGLGVGLLVLSASWATVASAGRSAFSPIAAGLLVAVALGIRERRRRPAQKHRGDRRPPRVSRVGSALAAAGFLVVVGLTYGATQAPSPRDEVQPVEFTDVGYYSALAISLDQTGTESLTTPSGFDSIEGLPAQSWYHWGELWIAAATIRVTGMDSVIVRNYVVLPLLLLSVAGLTGTMVRRVARTSSRGAFVFGAAASLLLAPLTVKSDVFFAHWAVGNMFGIGLYGLAMVVALVGIHVLVVGGLEARSPALSLFAGTVLASLLPSHIVMAALAFAGATGALLIAAARTVITGSRPRLVEPVWRTIALAALLGLATFAWGVATGHGLGGSAPSTLVTAFNPAWAQAILQTTLLSGAFLSIPIAWVVTRAHIDAAPLLFAGAATIAVVAAVGWGAGLADYNMFHVFFGAIAVFLTPMAAAAVWTLSIHLRAQGRVRLAAAVVIVAIAQMELAISPTIIRLEGVRPSGYNPIPVSVLAAIQSLPPDAKLAYSCQQDEEFTFSDPRLSTIYAHTGRRIVPMCFEEDVLSSLNGGSPSAGVENPLFRHAPQRVLFPDPTAYPSPASIRAFLEHHAIAYVYADDKHPNVLVPDAVPLIAEGGVVVLRIR